MGAGLSLMLLASCGGGSGSNSGPTTEALPNRAPVISGAYPDQHVVLRTYDYTPGASDPDGDELIFSINNLPSWAVFDTKTGRLSGLPGNGDVGDYLNIVVSVGDGELSDELEFNISVQSSPVTLAGYLGVPDPGNAFGYDPFAVEVKADPDEWPGSEAANFYFIDPSHPKSTDSNNTYGYPEKPRKTFDQFTVSAGGKIVLLGDGNTYSIGGPGRFQPSLNGSSDEPIFIEGRYVTTPPVLLKQLRFNDSSHVIVDDLMWTESEQTVSIQGDSHYITIRDSRFNGPGTDAGFRSVIGMALNKAIAVCNS